MFAECKLGLTQCGRKRPELYTVKDGGGGGGSGVDVRVKICVRFSV